MQRRRLWIVPLLAVLAGLTLLLVRRPDLAFPAPPPAPPAPPAPAAALAPDLPRPAAPSPGPADPDHGSLRVQVFANGLPLKDADVTVLREGFGTTIKFRTSASGSRQILQMPPGFYSVGALHPDYLPGEARTVVTAGSETPVKVEVLPGGRMTGRVTDTGGTPLPDTLVILVDAKSKFTITNALSTRTGPDGRYRMPAIPRGVYGVRFRNERFKVTDRYEYSYLVGTESYEVDVALEVGVMAGGRVLDGSGRPLPGVEVQVMGKQSIAFATSDAEGRWEGHGLYEGPLSVTAKKPGHGTVIVRGLPANARDVEIRMERAARLAGRLEIDGPPDSFMISLARFEPDLDRSLHVDARLFENRAKGDFEFEDLAPGSYDLHFEAEGYEALDRPRVTVAAGGTSADVRIRLRRK